MNIMDTNHKIAVGHNATGFTLEDGTVQVHYAGRALAKIESEGWTIVGESKTMTNGEMKARAITIENNQGEQRIILGYTIKATENSPYVMYVDNDDTIQWSRRSSNGLVRLHKDLATGETVQMFTVTYVGKDGSRQVSTQCYDRRYMSLIARQKQLGIERGTKLYVNPIEIIPSLAIVAMLLAGVKVSIRTRLIKETRETLNRFYQAELMRLDGASTEEQMEALA